MTNSFTKKQVGVAVACALAVALAASTLGCSPQQAVAAAAIKDKIYTVTPASVKVQAGMLSGEVTEMKVTERIEEGSGRVTSPAKLTGKLVLKNTSSDQTVRLIDAKILYIDARGNPIKLEKDRTEPTIKVASSYGSSDRLDAAVDDAGDADRRHQHRDRRLARQRPQHRALDADREQADNDQRDH